MKFFVLGTRRLDIPAGDRPEYHGIQCFVASKSQNVHGWETDKVSLRDSLLYGKPVPCPGSWIDVEFRRNSSAVALVNSVELPNDINSEDLGKTVVEFIVDIDA